MRVVLDTDIMVAAIRSGTGASRVVLDAVLDRRLVGIVTVALVVQYEAVLTRQVHLAASGLGRSEVLKLIDAVSAAARPRRDSLPLAPDAAGPRR
jgi:predicted nucleic acid-binding protein